MTKLSSGLTLALAISAILNLAFAVLTMVKKEESGKDAKDIRRYNTCEADKFVESYISGDLEVMKRGLIREWCISLLSKTAPIVLCERVIS